MTEAGGATPPMGSVQLVSARPEGVSQEPAVLREHAVVALAVPANQQRRALDVGEQHGDSAGW